MELSGPVDMPYGTARL